MKSFFFFFLIFSLNFSYSKDPYDDDLQGKNMICHNNSFSVEDWGLRFLSDNKVILFSLNKAMYEIYQYQRRYRTDLRNILIFKNKDIEYIINRTRLKLGNKQCKLVKGDPLILLQERIDSLKLNKRKGNKL
ncbi:MAG: hypothetical protein VX976_02675 [Pseudomonadota bacterium]|nr:hypothetical protein [Pseudomonadota bacterium]